MTTNIISCACYDHIRSRVKGSAVKRVKSPQLGAREANAGAGEPTDVGYAVNVPGRFDIVRIPPAGVRVGPILRDAR